MALEVSIRPARPDEQAILESLQRRASLNNPGDREALLANPDAIAVPLEQIAAGCVFIAERDGVVAGFAAVVPRSDGNPHAEGFYLSCGFFITGTVRTRFGVGLDMRRPL